MSESVEKLSEALKQHGSMLNECIQSVARLNPLAAKGMEALCAESLKNLTACASAVAQELTAAQAEPDSTEKETEL